MNHAVNIARKVAQAAKLVPPYTLCSKSLSVEIYFLCNLKLS